MLLLWVGLVGCADAPKARVPGAECSGACVSGGFIELDNRVHWPFELSSLHVGLDEAVGWAELPTDERHVVLALPLVAGGRYQLGLAANFDVPSGDDLSCRVSLRFSRAVHVDALPAAIKSELYLRDPTVPFGARPELAVTFENVRPLPDPVLPPALDDHTCREAEPVEKALCRAKLAVADAEKAHDVPRKRCSEDVKRRITEVVVQIDALRVARTQATDPAVVGDPAREALLTKKVEGLSASLDLCSREQHRSRPVETRDSTPECSEDELSELLEKRADRHRRGPLWDPREKGMRW